MAGAGLAYRSASARRFFRIVTQLGAVGIWGFRRPDQAEYFPLRFGSACKKSGAGVLDFYPFLEGFGYFGKAAE